MRDITKKMRNKMPYRLFGGYVFLPTIMTIPALQLRSAIEAIPLRSLRKM